MSRLLRICAGRDTSGSVPLLWVLRVLCLHCSFSPSRDLYNLSFLYEMKLKHNIYNFFMKKKKECTKKAKTHTHGQEVASTELLSFLGL